jgi:hypothetical protein
MKKNRRGPLAEGENGVLFANRAGQLEQDGWVWSYVDEQWK